MNLSKEELLKQKEQLEKTLARVNEELDRKVNQTERLANFLHSRLCNWNHIDGCSWEYSSWDKPCSTRIGYRKKAESLIDYTNQHMIGSTTDEEKVVDLIIGLLETL